MNADEEFGTNLTEAIRYLETVPHPDSKKHVMTWCRASPRVKAHYRALWAAQDAERAKVVKL